MTDRGLVARRAWLLPALLSVVALLASGVLVVRGHADASAPSPPGGAATSYESAGPLSPTVRPTTPSLRASPLPGAGTPTRVAIPSLGVDAAVVPIATVGTALEPPADPQVLGWWSGGAAAGAARGTALVTGHTVHDGGGALDDLEDLRPGTEIRVSTPQGTITYEATSVRVLDKVQIARQAPELFSQEVAGQLVLVTCEDWDGSGYRSNVVVNAKAVSWSDKETLK